MKQALKVAAFAVALAAVAGALAGAATVRSIPAAAVDDVAGIAHTKLVVIGRYHRDRIRAGNHLEGNSFTGTVRANVRGAVSKLGLQSGSWSARLFCPSPVSKHGDETFERTNVALTAGVSFTFSLATGPQAGLHLQTYECWLRVRMTLPEDGEVIVLRDAMLPVVVQHSQSLPDHRPPGT